MTSLVKEKPSRVDVDTVLPIFLQRFQTQQIWVNDHELTWHTNYGVLVPADLPYCLLIGGLHEYGYALLHIPLHSKQEPFLVKLLDAVHGPLLRRAQAIYDIESTENGAVQLTFQTNNTVHVCQFSL